jgi:hypothetical protein
MAGLDLGMGFAGQAADFADTDTTAFARVEGRREWGRGPCGLPYRAST